MNAVDTNVLIYSRDPRDPNKQAAANSLLASLAEGHASLPGRTVL
ncbi:MAG TPA: hypothetical protein VE642_10445 [Pyrinomonadaceae bacterium]|jgi:hypothetical protein|nr:hypothetical protein [Pyrinomonadaceae bacterium]